MGAATNGQTCLSYSDNYKLIHKPRQCEANFNISSKRRSSRFTTRAMCDHKQLYTFLHKNIFYKNTEAEICEIYGIF